MKKGKPPPPLQDIQPILPSPRTWLATAACVVAGGWFGAQRFFLGRYASGLLRLALFAGAVFCGGRVTRISGGMWPRLATMVLLGAMFDLLMIVAGPALMRRRRTPTSFFWPILLIPTHPTPRFTGTLLTLPALAVLLLYLHIANTGIEIGAKLAALGFVAFSILVGVYWVRNLVRVLYWNDLTDDKGRLPM